MASRQSTYKSFSLLSAECSAQGGSGPSTKVGFRRSARHTCLLPDSPTVLGVQKRPVCVGRGGQSYCKHGLRRLGADARHVQLITCRKSPGDGARAKVVLGGRALVNAARRMVALLNDSGGPHAGKMLMISQSFWAPDTDRLKSVIGDRVGMETTEFLTSRNS